MSWSCWVPNEHRSPPFNTINSILVLTIPQTSRKLSCHHFNRHGINPYPLFITIIATVLPSFSTLCPCQPHPHFSIPSPILGCLLQWSYLITLLEFEISRASARHNHLLVTKAFVFALFRDNNHTYIVALAVACLRWCHTIVFSHLEARFCRQHRLLFIVITVVALSLHRHWSIFILPTHTAARYFQYHLHLIIALTTVECFRHHYHVILFHLILVPRHHIPAYAIRNRCLLTYPFVAIESFLSLVNMSRHTPFQVT